MIRISVITVCYNNISTIRDTMESVLSQTHPDIEYLVIDGGSTDGTRELIEEYSGSVNFFISEPDTGIYNAINKGIMNATGDIVGLLHADDFFYNEEVISRVACAFEEDNIDALYGDVVFVSPGNPGKVLRYYSSKKFETGKFRFGFMPAHPSFYVRRICFEKYGYYKEDYIIGADFDLLLRFMYHNKIKTRYIEMPFVKMRAGGISNKSLGSRIVLNREILRSCRENGIKTNYLNIYSKYVFKIFEFRGRII